MKPNLEVYTVRTRQVPARLSISAGGRVQSHRTRQQLPYRGVGGRAGADAPEAKHENQENP